MSLQNYWVNAEVTEGSIFGLTLFLPYINDSPDNVISNVAVYADDVTLYSKRDPSVNFWLESDLQNIVDLGWMWMMNSHGRYTHSSNQEGGGGGRQKIDKKGWEVAKNFSLIRREGGANFFSCFSWGKGVLRPLFVEAVPLWQPCFFWPTI